MAGDDGVRVPTADRKPHGPRITRRFTDGSALNLDTIKQNDVFVILLEAMR
jgi:hypothetical protein